MRDTETNFGRIVHDKKACMGCEVQLRTISFGRYRYLPATSRSETQLLRQMKPSKGLTEQPPGIQDAAETPRAHVCIRRTVQEMKSSTLAAVSPVPHGTGRSET